MQVDSVEIGLVKPYPGNPRRNRKSVGKVADSIMEYGWQQPIVVDEQMVIIAGHTRLQAAKRLKLKQVPIQVATGLTPEQVRAYRLMDNRSGEDSQWDDDLLNLELTSLLDINFDLALTGFSNEELADVLPTDDRPGTPGEDDFGDVQEISITKRGDIWKLGEHRLYCADSMQASTFDELIGENKIGLIATDPPYAIYGSSTGIASDIADDKMVRPFFEKVLTIAKDRLEWFAHCYVFCDWRSWPAIWEACRDVPHIEAKNLLIWDKGDSGLGSNYANTYECVGFFMKLPKQKVMGGRPSGQRSVYKPNMMRHNRVTGKDRMHNAAKPVALMRDLIENSSEPGDIVLDPFGGSGSTLIAAEQTGRACFAVEIDPGCCDIIVKRWEQFTDKEAVRDS